MGEGVKHHMLVLDESLHKEVKKKAKDQGVTFNDIVTKALEEYFKKGGK